MTYKEIILELIPVSGCTLKALRAHFRGDVEAMEHALVGLIADGTVRKVLDTVTIPANAVAQPPERVWKKGGTAARTAEREAIRRWKLANPDKVRAYRIRENERRKSTRAQINACVCKLAGEGGAA